MQGYARVSSCHAYVRLFCFIPQTTDEPECARIKTVMVSSVGICGFLWCASFGSTTKHRGRDVPVGFVLFSTSSKKEQTPPEWGLRGNCVPSRSSVSTPLRILHGILWCYQAAATASRDRFAKRLTKKSPHVSIVPHAPRLT